MFKSNLYKRSSAWKWRGAALSLTVGVSVLIAVPGSAVADSEPLIVGATDTPAQALAVAQATNAPVVVDSMTSETNQVVARPDGAFELEANREPVRTDINGDWEPIDTSLHLNSDGTISPAAITLPVEFGAAGSSDIVTAGDGGDAITFRWDEGDLPTPVVSGSQVTYPDVRPGVDLVFTAQPTGYSDALVVENQAAAQALADDPVSFTGTSEDLDLSKTPDGAVVGTNPDTGATLVSPPPLAWDSSGGGHGDDRPAADTPGTAVVNELPPASVENASGESMVTMDVAPPAAAISNPDTEYPLYLDPQISGRGNMHYLTVHSKGWDYYDVDSQVMRVGYCGWDECNTSIQGNARSFFSFDITPLSYDGSDPHIFDATVQAQQVWNASSGAQPVNLTKATAFSSGTNYPGPVGASLQQIDSAAGYGGNNEAWLKFSNANVQSYLQTAGTNEANAIQFSLSAPSEGNKYYWKKFNNNTKLTVVFAYPPSITSYTASGVVACPSLPVYSRGSIAMKETANEVYTIQSYGMDYAFQVFSSDSSNNGPWDSTTLKKSSGWIDTPSYTATGLTDGLYAWRAGGADHVGVKDANGDYYPDVTRWTDPATRPFTVDTVKPAAPTVTSDDYPADYWGRSAANPGTFTVGVPSDAVAVGYSFNGTPPSVTDTTCTYTSGGYAVPTSGKVTLTGSNLVAGAQNTLSVYSFDRAHNRSAVTTTYKFYVSPDLAGTTTTNRVELESSSIAKTKTGNVNNSGDTATPAVGSYSIATSTDPDGAVEYDLPISAPGYYAIGVKLGTCTTCGTAQIDIPDSQVSNTAPVSTTSSFDGSTYVTLGGYILSQGTHKLRVRFPDAGPSSYSIVKLDYATVAQIQGGSYGSSSASIASNLAAAFNNKGIATENGAGASFETGVSTAALSKQKLASIGIIQGGSFTTSFLETDGLTTATATFAIPNATSDGRDNVISAGQHITMPTGTTADHVDFLVAATCAPVPPKPRSLFDLVHQPATGPSVTTNPSLPATIPTWLSSPDGQSITPIAMSGYATGPTPAVATPGSASLYVIEVDVEQSHKSEPLVSVTLPSTGASLTQGCTAAPLLHVLAMTTRTGT